MYVEISRHRAFIQGVSISLITCRSPFRSAVPLISVGASINWIIPSAHIGLSPTVLHELHPWAQIRVAAGGAWHNIVLWVVLWLSMWSGALPYAGKLAAWPLFIDYRLVGRVVLSVDPVSHRLSIRNNRRAISGPTFSLGLAAARPAPRGVNCKRHQRRSRTIERGLEGRFASTKCISYDGMVPATLLACRLVLGMFRVT